MPWFKCFIRGENFPGQIADIDELAGFYVTRCVQSVDASQAELDAVELLRGDEKLNLSSSDAASDARVYVEETALLEDDEERPKPGFIFFRMSDK